jgi:alkylhydroperoxidase family enzyme
MDPMFLKEIEDKPATGEVGQKMAAMKAAGAPIPQIWHLFAFRPEMTQHLARFTQEAMRGPSPLSPGMRELIAAFTSSQNQCPF